MPTYSISQISHLSGLPSKTIRFYEDSGIISKVERKENGYRQYQESNLTELKLIKAARDLGLPLSEIKHLMTGCYSGHCSHSKETISDQIENYLSLLDNQINQLNQLKSKLSFLQNHLDCDGPYCCDLLHQLINLKPEGGDSND